MSGGLGLIAKFISACLEAIGDNMLLSLLFNYSLHASIECSYDCHQDSGFVMVVDLAIAFVFIGLGLYICNIFFAFHPRYVVGGWDRDSLRLM